jgi:SAM-dependent methyltransferase
MDLRAYLRDGDIAPATRALNYQPFILSDNVQTEAAFSWFDSGDPRVAPPLVFRRQDCSPERWAKVSEINGRLRAMYDDLLDEIASRFPGGSLLDIACCNGYFPVGAELRGMKGTGIDIEQHARAVSFLNAKLGTKARFIPGLYRSDQHRLPHLGGLFRKPRFDVVCMSAIMCHLPDPLHFLAAAARMANHAILFWGQVLDTPHLLISYNKPHHALSLQPTAFPNGFNDNTRLSLGLFAESALGLGFSKLIKIEPRATWLAALSSKRDLPLETEISEISEHMALLLVR